MNGAAYRALAAVLAAASASDREAYLARRPEIDRVRIDEAVAVFESRFGGRRWRTHAHKDVLEKLLLTAERQEILTPLGELTDAKAETAKNNVLSDDIALPVKTRRALNTILSAYTSGSQ